MSERSIALYYKDGSSDKVYQAQTVLQGAGYLVNFQYGRRGGTLQSGTKTAKPVDLATAEKIFYSLIAEKARKGYTPEQGGTVFQGTENANKVSGMRPQLLNRIDEKRAEELIADPNYFMQEKKDGERRMVRMNEDRTVIGANRNGLVVPLPQNIVQAILGLRTSDAQLLGSAVLDAEIIGDVLHVFDVLEVNDVDLRSEPAWVRYGVLERDLLDNDCNSLKLVVAAKSREEKRKLFDEVKAARGEGLVFKASDSCYVPGKPASGGSQLKFKFTEPATCQVIERNGAKRSVQIAVDLHGMGVAVGNVTIPANFEIPEPLSFVEVEYLYAYPNGGSLYQPVYKGPRPDKDRADAYDTLKFKQGTDEEEG